MTPDQEYNLGKEVSDLAEVFGSHTRSLGLVKGIIENLVSDIVHLKAQDEANGRIHDSTTDAINNVSEALGHVRGALRGIATLADSRHEQIRHRLEALEQKATK